MFAAFCSGPTASAPGTQNQNLLSRVEKAELKSQTEAAEPTAERPEGWKTPTMEAGTRAERKQGRRKARSRDPIGGWLPVTNV